MRDGTAVPTRPIGTETRIRQPSSGLPERNSGDGSTLAGAGASHSRGTTCFPVRHDGRRAGSRARPSPVPAWMNGKGGQPEGYCHRETGAVSSYLVAGARAASTSPSWDRPGRGRRLRDEHRCGLPGGGRQHLARDADPRRASRLRADRFARPGAVPAPLVLPGSSRSAPRPPSTGGSVRGPPQLGGRGTRRVGDGPVLAVSARPKWAGPMKWKTPAIDPLIFCRSNGTT